MSPLYASMCGSTVRRYFAPRLLVGSRSVIHVGQIQTVMHFYQARWPCFLEEISQLKKGKNVERCQTVKLSNWLIATFTSPMYLLSIHKILNYYARIDPTLHCTKWPWNIWGKNGQHGQNGHFLPIRQIANWPFIWSKWDPNNLEKLVHWSKL